MYLECMIVIRTSPFEKQDLAPPPTAAPPVVESAREEKKEEEKADVTLVDEYNYETVTDEYYTPLPYDDLNYDDIDTPDKLPEGAVEAEIPTSTVITYNETDVIFFSSVQ